MTGKPEESTDAEVRAWMKFKGWEVTEAECDFAQDIYTRKGRSLQSAHSPAMRISRQVLVDFPAFAVLEHLDRLNVADAIRRRPGASYVLVQKGSSVLLREAE